MIKCLAESGPADDEAVDSAYIIKKILQARLFDDKATGAMWKANVKEIGGEVLCGSL